MKKLNILLSLFLVAASLSLGAAENPKIATIDLKKVFEDYWKRIKADANLREEASDLQLEEKKMREDFKKSEEAYKTALKSAGDQAVSSEEREKRKKQAEEMLVRLEEKDAGIQQFRRTASSRMMERNRRIRDELLKEIREHVDAKAKAGGYTLVLNSTAESENVPFVLFSTNEHDLTALVLKDLNANAPEGVFELKKGEKKDKEPEDKK